MFSRALVRWTSLGIYRAQLAQSGSGHPLVLEMENSVGPVEWKRIAPGIFYGFGDFAGTVLPEVGQNDQVGTLRLDVINLKGVPTLRLMCRDLGEQLTDGVAPCTIDIRRYR